jgi:hypothetical protein
MNQSTMENSNLSPNNINQVRQQQSLQLKSLNKIELDQRIKSLAGKERELLLEVLQTIKEIDSRKSYADMGYPSLFAYLTQGVGYSESSAYRRIQGARLLSETPQLAAKIQSGDINLNQISKIQSAVKAVQKQTSKKVTSAEKSMVLSQIENMNKAQTEKHIADFFDIPVLTDVKKTTQKDESVRIELTIPKEAYEKIQKAQGLVAHAVNSNDLLDFLNYVADRVIKQKTQPKAKAAKAAKTTRTAETAQFSQRNKKMALQKSNCCEYQNPLTKKVCGSTWYLQVDHRTSVWAGGNGKIENSQILCAEHNQLKYRNEASLRRIT